MGEVLLDVLTQQCYNTRHVGCCHGGARNAVVILAGNSRQDRAAVSGDLGLDLQVGCGTPGGEAGHEGAGGLCTAEHDGALALRCQHLTVVLADGAGGDGGVTDVHADLTRNVVVNDYGSRALCLRDVDLFLKGGRASGHQRDLAGHVDAGVVGRAACTGDEDEFQLQRVNALGKHVLDQLLCLARSVCGVGKVDDLAVVHHVGGLCTLNGGYAKRACIGGGRADGCRVGVGGKTQVTVLFRAIGGVVAVGGRNHQADACLADVIVNARDLLLFGFGREAAGGTDGEVDDVNAQNNAVLQRAQNPGGARLRIGIREDLHGHQLCIGSNTGDGVVAAGDDTRYVRTVVGLDGVNVRVSVRIVKAVGNLFADVDVGGGQTALDARGLGLANQRLNVSKGHAQLASIGGEVANRESGVVIVQTRVQNCHDHACAVVSEVGRVENTGLVNVDYVFHQLGLCGQIDLADDGLCLTFKEVVHAIKIAGLDGDFKAREHGVVFKTLSVVKSCRVQLSQQLASLGRNAVLDCRCRLGLCIFGKRQVGVGFLVRVHDGGKIGFDDQRNNVRIRHGVGELVHHVLIKEVLDICLHVAVEQPDILRALCTGNRDRGHGQQHGQHHGQYDRGGDHPCKCFLVHVVFFAFLCFCLFYKSHYKNDDIYNNYIINAKKEQGIWPIYDLYM